MILELPILARCVCGWWFSDNDPRAWVVFLGRRFCLRCAYYGFSPEGEPRALEVCP